MKSNEVEKKMYIKAKYLDSNQVETAIKNAIVRIECESFRYYIFLFMRKISNH